MIAPKRQRELILPERGRYTELTADQSADLLAQKVRSCEPFFFTKYGDGALECINGLGSHTCDREHYSPELGAELTRTWEAVRESPSLILADWTSAVFDALRRGEYPELYEAFIGPARPQWVHYEAVLINRRSTSLLGFYEAVKRFNGRKLILGPSQWAGACRMLGATHIPTRMGGLLGQCSQIEAQLRVKPFDMLLYGAGMAGTIPVIDVWRDHPERTYINLGSALDPLFRCNSRKQQLPMTQARQFFRPLL